MTMNLATTEHRSKPAAPKENKYNSKPSIEKSFDIAEKTKSPPISILARVFKVTRYS
jgi:hypothetical protein